MDRQCEELALNHPCIGKTPCKTPRYPSLAAVLGGPSLMAVLSMWVLQVDLLLGSHAVLLSCGSALPRAEV